MNIDNDTGGTSWCPETNFEGMPHQALHSMVADADPAAVLGVGAALSEAGAHIQSLADELAQHIIGLQWTGSAADSFTAWARRLISSTDTLAAYADNTGTAVTMAGEQLSASKAAMPPVPYSDMATVAAYKRQQQRAPGSAGLTLDGTVQDPTQAGPAATPPGGVTQHQAFAAQTNIEAQYQEALLQMESLGGAYVGAVETMGQSKIPTFPPLPDSLMPPPGVGVVELTDVPVPAGALLTSGSSLGRKGLAHDAAAADRNEPSTRTHSGPAGTTLVPAQSLGIGGYASTDRGGGTVIQGHNPPTGPSVTGSGNGEVSGNGTAGAGGGTHIRGGGHVWPPALVTGGMGNARSAGTARASNASGYVGEASSAADESLSAGFSSGAIGSDRGISGGVASISPSLGKERYFGAPAIGREEVITADGATAGHGLGGTRPMPEAVSSGGSSSARLGQRESGGSEGTDAEHAVQAANGSEFLPMGGMNVAASAWSVRKRGRRAGYLVEDPETWTSGVPQVNPAVVE